jgi:endonuclease/exonuclease/phosphatase (EEP) superfamily protein YafD
VTYLLIVATAALVLATALGDHRDWRLSLMGHFRAHLAAASLICAGLVAALGLSSVGTLLIFVLLLCAAFNAYVVVAKTRPSRERSDGRSDGTKVRLFFSNLLEANQSTDLVLDWVRREQPDLFVCAEAHRHWRQALSALEPHHAHVAGSNQGDVMIFSRRPFESEPLELFAEVGHAVVARVGGLTVVGLHTASPESRLRKAALDELLAKVAGTVRETTGPVVVVGDFNASPWTVPVRRLMEATELRSVPGALGGSFPSKLGGRRVPTWLGIPIDIVLVGRGARALRRRRGPFVGSDHWPVAIDVTYVSS